MNTRRGFLIVSFAPLAIRGAEPAGSGSMMWDYMTAVLQEADGRRRKILESLETPGEIRVFRRRVRRRLRGMWGGLPRERTPLNPRPTGSVDRRDFMIEKLTFESRPEFHVTANLYRPKEVSGRLPAVIFPCGHSANGKAAESYQRFCILLARNGFVVFTWDPVGQGERLQLWDPAKNASEAGNGTGEHHVLGRQCYLLGINLMQYRVWDAMRAIDYLETRADVDAERIGCAGNSGGGMETLQLAPVETRIKAAVPMCAVATFRDKTEALLIADPEQILSRTLGWNIDHPELLSAVAPRPLLIGSAIQDYVPIAGARRTFAEIQPVYRRLNAVDKVRMVETDDRHGLNRELREGAASWLARWLKGSEESIWEEAADISTDEELQCTSSGQVATSVGGETVFTLNRKLAREIAPRRTLPRTPGQAEVYRREIAELSQRVTRLNLSRPEEGIYVPRRVFGSPPGPAVLLVAESGKDDPALMANVIDPLVRSGFRVTGIDVRGWGETRPHMPEKRVGFSWEDFFTYRSFELGRPLFGQRLRDLLVTAPEVADEDEWTLVGVGAGGLLGAYAAVLEPRIRRVAAIGAMVSYRSLIEDTRCRQPFSTFLPGVIGAYEIRDLLAAIAPRDCLMVNPEDAQRRPASEADAEREFDWSRSVYRVHNAEERFALRCGVPGAETGSTLAEWLRAM